MFSDFKKYMLCILLVSLISATAIAPSASVANDEIKALEQKLEALKAKAKRKIDYDKMRAILEQKRNEVDEQIRQLDLEYSDVKSSSEVTVTEAKKDDEKFDIVRSMKDKPIEMTFEQGKRPFRIKESKKEKGMWFMENQNNFQKSPIIVNEKNLIVMNGFPRNWTINGEFKFTQKGSNCLLNQVQDPSRVFKWAC